MDFYPRYKLYAANGSTLVYTFDYITAENSPSDPIKYTEISGMRGQGSLIVPGSLAAWDLELSFFLKGANYEAVISAMDSLETTIVMNTAYVLKIGRTNSTTKDYHVKRILPIRWDTSLRTRSQKGVVIFRANAW